MKGSRTVFAALVAVVMLVVFLGIASEFQYGRDYAHPVLPSWGGMPMGSWVFWGAGMWIFPLIGLVIFLFLIHFLFTRVCAGSSPFCGWGRQAGENAGQQSPMDVLKMRYAKGEIGSGGGKQDVVRRSRRPPGQGLREIHVTFAGLVGAGSWS